MQIAFPYVFDPQHLTGLVDRPAHIRQMLEQLLFTMPGERVNRPDFGCGVQRMVFSPQGTEVIATLRTLVESEIHRWLGDVITLRDLNVEADDTVLRVRVEYLLPLDNNTHVAQYERTP